jgi:cytochrome b pre-mRNA-processing protein 3
MVHKAAHRDNVYRYLDRFNPHHAIKTGATMFRVFPRHQQADTIRALYGVIVAQARAPSFYAAYLVPDTVGGRFDMIVLHLALLLRRLRREPAELGALGQSVFDLFCTDMDHSLREMGVGDLAVPKHMRRLGEAFYGRALAYARALDVEGGELAPILARNVFSTEGATPPGAVRLASYVRAAEACLNDQLGAAFATGVLRFPDPDTIWDGEEHRAGETAAGMP